ncbi:MAG TPA: thiol:disulfide interchange protein DsbA/DsbL [Gammaproteobacteria bacterium]|nr:thiol:disulfide interchange protein DsbA/DsbL [Gammaproteobacteria bacterium]
MKRVLICFFFCWPLLVLAGNTTLSFEEGKHFQRADLSVISHDLVQEYVNRSPNKVHVIEFFSYGCHWCYSLDPLVEAWLKTKPEFVSFERIPIAFQPGWQPLAKVFFSAEILGVTEKVHAKLFSAIQGRKLAGKNGEEFTTLFDEIGVPPTLFLGTYNSFSVQNKFNWGNGLARAYKITAIPMIVVQGPSGTFFTGVHFAGSESILLQVVNYLIKQEHLALLKQKKTT